MPTPAPIAPANARTRMFDAYEDGEISGATFDRLVTQRAAAIAAELQALGVGPIRVGRPFLEESDEEDDEDADRYWEEEDEEMNEEKDETASDEFIAQLQKENEQSQSLDYSRACFICLCQSPVRRVCLVACGHITCRACAERMKKEKRSERFDCPFCRAKTTFVPLFENINEPLPLEN